MTCVCNPLLHAPYESLLAVIKIKNQKSCTVTYAYVWMWYCVIIDYLTCHLHAWTVTRVSAVPLISSASTLVAGLADAAVATQLEILIGFCWCVVISCFGGILTDCILIQLYHYGQIYCWIICLNGHPSPHYWIIPLISDCIFLSAECMFLERWHLETPMHSIFLYSPIPQYSHSISIHISASDWDWR